MSIFMWTNSTLICIGIETIDKLSKNKLSQIFERQQNKVFNASKVKQWINSSINPKLEYHWITHTINVLILDFTSFYKFNKR